MNLVERFKIFSIKKLKSQIHIAEILRDKRDIHLLIISSSSTLSPGQNNGSLAISATAFVGLRKKTAKKS